MNLNAYKTQQEAINATKRMESYISTREYEDRMEEIIRHFESELERNERFEQIRQTAHYKAHQTYNQGRTW